LVPVDATPHSHSYRQDTILQCVAFTVKRMGEIHKQAPEKSKIEMIPNIITNWLDENTLLTTRTKQDYAKIINVKSKKEITWG
jgi:hypothetical protein